MPADRTAKRNRLATDLAELRDIAATSRADLRALPAAASRTPAQRTQAKNLRFQLIVARSVLLMSGAGTDAEVDDAQ